MNRKVRRALKAHVGKLAHPVPDSVRLIGGPMSDWIVRPDAPALRPDWWRTWPPFIATAWAPGQYVRDAQEARWEPTAE